jgi:hypothetical protein
VRFFPPEPVHRITAFHNIAPLDPHGGHTGLEHEYHCHRAPAVMANDSGTVVGYALDGFPILGRTEAGGGQPVDLDDINGHNHDGIGYHYYASSRWPYFAEGFRGPLGTAALGEVDVCDATARTGRGRQGSRKACRPRLAAGRQADRGGGILHVSPRRRSSQADSPTRPAPSLPDAGRCQRAPPTLAAPQELASGRDAAGLYFAVIEALDTSIGRILDALAQEHLLPLHARSRTESVTAGGGP